MGFLDEVEDLKAGEGLVHLSKVTLIAGSLVGDPIWGTLLDDYRKIQTPEKACSISILNAALTHWRRIFALTRDGVEALVRTDPNWAHAPVFNTKSWSKYLLFMHERNMITKIFEGHVSVYELKFAPLLSVIPENDQHKLQAIRFAEHRKKIRTSVPKEDISISRPPRIERKLKPYVPNPESLAEIDKLFKFEGSDDDIFDSDGSDTEKNERAF